MRHIKKIIEWVAGFFSLVGFFCFLAGVYSLSLVDLFYFSEEITPATFSAAFAGGALILACYTALKVNKWLNNKINDTAFKKAEELIQSLSSFIISIADLIRMLESINTSKSISEHGLSVIQKKLGNSHAKYMEDGLKLSILLEQLHAWGVELKIKSELEDIFIRLDQSKSPTKTNKILGIADISMKSHRQRKKGIEEIVELSKTAIIGFQDCLKDIRSIINKNHIELFSYNNTVKPYMNNSLSTSPSKKDD